MIVEENFNENYWEGHSNASTFGLAGGIGWTTIPGTVSQAFPKFTTHWWRKWILLG